MREQMKKITRIILSVGVILFLFNLKTVNAQPQRETFYFNSKSNAESKATEYYTQFKPEVSSSNEEVATVSTKKTGKNTWETQIKFKKTGKVSITMNGNKNNYNVVSYKCPVKEVKIGKKNLTSSYKESRRLSGNSLNGKLSIKPNSGYKIVEVYKFSFKSLRSKGSAGKFTSYTNGKNISLKKGDRLVIKLSNGKNNYNLFYTVR